MATLVPNAAARGWARCRGSSRGPACRSELEPLAEHRRQCDRHCSWSAWRESCRRTRSATWRTRVCNCSLGWRRGLLYAAALPCTVTLRVSCRGRIRWCSATLPDATPRAHCWNTAARRSPARRDASRRCNSRPKDNDSAAYPDHARRTPVK